jgi:Cu(I)/Ag(I) efflux system periplasmic protein CusF
MKHLVTAAVLAMAGVFSSTTVATTHTGAEAHAPHHAALTEGEIRKVDKDARKLTIRHGPITSLDMPAMTMVFQVQDPAVLDQVKVGDKVRFVAEKREGAFIVTAVEVDKR